MSAAFRLTAEANVSDEVSNVMMPFVMECDFTVAPAIVSVESLLPALGKVAIVAAEGAPCRLRTSVAIAKSVITS